MRTRTRLYNLSWAFAFHAPEWAKSAHASVWLRILDVRDLNDITVESYQRITGFEGAEHNLFGLWSWEEAAVREHLAGCRTILVAGAGGGREVIALARMGFAVTGFDASPALTEACRANLGTAGVDATILDAPPGEVPREIGTFGGLFVGRGVYHHIPRRAARIDFLAACRSNLAPGAPLVISDFLTRKSGRRPARSSARVERGDFVGNAFYHSFTSDEVRSELDEAGFELLDFRPSPFERAYNLAHVLARARPGPAASHD